MEYFEKKNLLGYPILWFQPASSFFNNEPSLIKNLFFWVQEPDSLISSCVKHASLDNTVEQLEKMILNKNINYGDLIGMKLPQRLIQIGKNDPQGIGRLICIADYCQINIIVLLTSKIDQHMIVNDYSIIHPDGKQSNNDSHKAMYILVSEEELSPIIFCPCLRVELNSKSSVDTSTDVKIGIVDDDDDKKR